MKRLLKYAFVICAFIILSGTVHMGMAALMAANANKGTALLAKRKVFVTYTELEPQFCLFQVCLKAKNVSVRLPNTSVVLCPVDLSLKKGLFGPYQITATAQKAVSDCMQITGKIAGTPDFWHIQDFSFWQNGLGGILAGTVDMRGQEMKLEGQTQGLADLISSFIPQNFQFLAMLVFSNGAQKISVRTDENYIRIFDVPILPKSVIFHQ